MAREIADRNGSAWAPAAYQRDPDEALDSYVRPGFALLIVAIWRVNLNVTALCVFLHLSV